MPAVEPAPSRDTDAPPTPSDPAATVRDLVLRYGYNSNDFLALYGGWRYFISDQPRGAVMFVERGRTYVACGDPICAGGDLSALLAAFDAWSRAQRRRTAFLGASERLAAVAVGQGFGALKVGEEPFFDVASYAPRGDRTKKVRSAANQARRNGVATRVYRPIDGTDRWSEAEAATLLRAWLATRPAGEMAFGLTLEPFTGKEVKRYVVAEQYGRMAGFVACSPMPARNAFYLEDVIRAPDAPNGTTEVLVLAALDMLRDEGVALATLGVAPLAGVERQPFGRHPVLRRVLALARDHLNGAYHFASLNHYKRKYAPSAWEGSYLLYRPARLTPGLAWSLISAFTPGSPLASLRETLRRRVRAMRPAAPRRRLRSAPRLPAGAALLALAGALWLLAARTTLDNRGLALVHHHLFLAAVVSLGLAAASAGRLLPRRA